MDINYHWRTKLRRELPLRFFVVFVAVQDLLLRAEYLFVAASTPTARSVCGRALARAAMVRKQFHPGLDRGASNSPALPSSRAPSRPGGQNHSWGRMRRVSALS
jgi:hypothetical protein